jgi:hypothetical protein
MESVSPVWTEDHVEIERVIALDQPEYQPIIVLPVEFAGGELAMSVRFRLSEEERAEIARGGDLVITELSFGRAFTPLHVKVCGPNEAPEF